MTKQTRQAARQAKQLFRLCLIDGRLDEGRVRRVVERIIASKRRGSLLLLSYFKRYVKLDRVQHVAEIESAIPLPPDLQTRVQADLEHLYGKGISIVFAHRPELIGGMRVRVGSDIYDGTLQSELAALERKF